MGEPRPFEDPRITELRSRCEAAIETAGYDLVEDLVKIVPPAPAGLKGKIVGHCQSINSEDRRFVYYVHVDGTKALSGFLSGVATAAQDTDECDVYVVVTESSSALEKSCRGSGAGLLRLTEENTFELVVSPDEYALEERHKLLIEKGKELRRRLETKHGLNEEKLRTNFKEVEDLTTGMAAEVRDDYILGIHRAVEAWAEWFDVCGNKLDEALGLDDEELLKAVERLIEAGAILDEDVEPHES